MKKIKNILSIMSFLSSIVIAYIAVFLPPLGIIDNSVLWFTAQLLLFTTSLLGINGFDIERLRNEYNSKKI